MIYLQESTAIDRGGKEAYLESLATEWAPYAEESRGMRLFWIGSTIGSTSAWPETIALWQLRDWDHWAEVCSRMYTETSPDARLREWWRAAAKHRVRSRSRTLVGAEFSPSLDDLVAGGVAGTAFAFKTYRVLPGKMPGFFSALEKRVEVEQSRGRRLVGAYEVAFTNDLACAIWAHRGLEELTTFEAARDRAREWPLDGILERSSEHWGYATPRCPLWPRDYETDVRVW